MSLKPASHQKRVQKATAASFSKSSGADLIPDWAVSGVQQYHDAWARFENEGDRSDTRKSDF